MHFRGTYHNPFMLLPVSLPPVAAALLGNAAMGKLRVRRHVTRWWLRATTVMGIAGFAFHAYGVLRNMGGWRNWRQTVLTGPPLPAPPSFSGLALAGLASLGLLEDPAVCSNCAFGGDGMRRLFVAATDLLLAIDLVG